MTLLSHLFGKVEINKQYVFVLLHIAKLNWRNSLNQVWFVQLPAEVGLKVLEVNINLILYVKLSINTYFPHVVWQYLLNLVSLQISLESENLCTCP